MRRSVNLAELPCRWHLILLEGVFYVVTKPVENLLPVHLRLGVRLFRRMRSGLPLVGTLLCLAARCNIPVGLIAGVNPLR